MGATSNARERFEQEGFFDKYLQGKGIDIGAGSDPITPDCTQWDLLDGDARWMLDCPEESFDWVYSSHCLEHLDDPSGALARWWQLVRPGGYLIISVPDFKLYELGMWPSHLNPDHKSRWQVEKLQAELAQLDGGAVEYVKLVDTRYDYSLLNSAIAYVIISDPKIAKAMDKHKQLTSEMISHDPLRVVGFWPIDQTAQPFYAEASVEGVVRKLL